MEKTLFSKKTIWLITEDYDGQDGWGRSLGRCEYKRGYAETEAEAKKWVKKQKKSYRFFVKEIEQV